jgi:hypothetical protein
MRVIDARGAKSQARKANEVGYDLVVDHYMKKIDRASNIGLYNVNEPNMSYMKFTDQHARYFEGLGYSVIVDGSIVDISWE